MIKSKYGMPYYFTAQIKSLDYIADVINYLRMIGCKAWQHNSTWVICCIIPEHKIKDVMDAYDVKFSWDD